MTSKGTMTAAVLAVLLALGLAAHHSASAAKFAEWSAPDNLGPVINSGFAEVSVRIIGTSTAGAALVFGVTIKLTVVLPLPSSHEANRRRSHSIGVEHADLDLLAGGRQALPVNTGHQYLLRF